MQSLQLWAQDMTGSRSISPSAAVFFNILTAYMKVLGFSLFSFRFYLSLFICFLYTLFADCFFFFAFSELVSLLSLSCIFGFPRLFVFHCFRTHNSLLDFFLLRSFFPSLNLISSLFLGNSKLFSTMTLVTHGELSLSSLPFSNYILSVTFSISFFIWALTSKLYPQ